MLELFLEYRQTSGWWNQNGNFSLEAFLGLTLYYEYATTPPDGVAPFTEAASRKLWWWCAESNCSNDYAAVLNYIGTRQVMRSRYADWKSGDSLTDKTLRREAYNFPRALNMATTAIHPSDLDWKSGRVGYDVPWDWGNLSMFPKGSHRAIQLAASEPSLAVNSVVYFYGNDANVKNGKAFVIMTYNQEKYWKTYP